MPFKVIQCHRYWYQSKAHMRLPVYELTSYLTPFPSYCRLLVKFSLLTAGYLSLTHSFGVNLYTRDHEIWHQEIRNFALSYGVDIFTADYLVLSQSMRLTDGQTDGRTDVCRQ